MRESAFIKILSLLLASVMIAACIRFHPQPISAARSLVETAGKQGIRILLVRYLSDAAGLNIMSVDMAGWILKAPERHYG